MPCCARGACDTILYCKHFCYFPVTKWDYINLRQEQWPNNVLAIMRDTVADQCIPAKVRVGCVSIFYCYTTSKTCVSWRVDECVLHITHSSHNSNSTTAQSTSAYRTTFIFKAFWYECQVLCSFFVFFCVFIYFYCTVYTFALIWSVICLPQVARLMVLFLYFVVNWDRTYWALAFCLVSFLYIFCFW